MWKALVVGDGKASGPTLSSNSWLCSLGNEPAEAPRDLSCIPSGSVCVSFLLFTFFSFPTAATGLSALPLPVNKLGLWDNKNSVLQKKQGVL